LDLSTFNPAIVIVTVVALALAPFVAVMITAFTKIVVVLSLLRNALGLQQTPPNVVINGLAIILSFYVMQPVIIEAERLARAEYATMDQSAPLDVAGLTRIAGVAAEPLREFLLRHSTEQERAFFYQSARRLLAEDAQAQVTQRDWSVIVPAFTVTELTAAFQIGFLIFLPFLVIDLVVSNILLALGMMMLSPTMISLPFKLLLFVLLDGWAKLVHGLVLTYL
jgi:type III secretion protein R